MSKRKKNPKKPSPNQKRQSPKKRVVKSLLDEMAEGREYSSIIDCVPENMNLRDEIRKGIRDIQDIRDRPLVCYFSNVVNPQISSSIEYSDDLPFSEMIDGGDSEQKSIDVIIVTPGGSGEQVAKFVNKLRPRFDNVAVIIPDIAMSAGTLFSLAADDIIMDSRAHIGPIDPQIPNRDGRFVPAQSLLTALADIQKRGEDLLKQGQNPLWSDIQILNKIDPKEIGTAINSSRYSIELAQKYLKKYKFMHWNKHSNGRPVTEEEKGKRSTEIAALLCNHDAWKTHGRGITREAAWDICKIKITKPEETQGLEFAIRKLWTLVYWLFENSSLSKIFISEDYSIFRARREQQ